MNILWEQFTAMLALLLFADHFLISFEKFEWSRIYLLHVIWCGNIFFLQEKLSWQEEKSQLESKIELITKAHAQDMENERVNNKYMH